jgi:hypothetical protein
MNANRFSEDLKLDKLYLIDHLICELLRRGAASNKRTFKVNVVSAVNFRTKLVFACRNTDYYFTYRSQMPTAPDLVHGPFVKRATDVGSNR